MRAGATYSLALVALLAAVGCEDMEPAGPLTDLPTAEARKGPGGSAVYEVSFTNLTEMGQPFTPPLAAIHRQPISMFTVGRAASFGLKEIAENGNLQPMVETLGSSNHVASFAVVLPTAGPPPLMPGETRSVELTSERGANYLSFVSMLICTNDGFTGSNSLPLPRGVGDSETVYAAAYDAGTEINTEDFADMVPPCPALTGVDSDDPGTGASDPALAEGGVIHHHDGIAGGADLVPAIHDWTNPVSMVTVTRIE